ncbi:MAG: hypothetical protein ACRDKE_07320 [Solirubrobacterales bacterium]
MRVRSIIVSSIAAGMLLVAALGSTATAQVGPDLPIAWSGEYGQLSQLGPVKIEQSATVTARKMLRTFGKPSRTRMRYGSCQRYWRKYGLTAWFANFGAARKSICKQRGAALQSVTITRSTAGADWHTIEGLRINDPISRIEQLYPETASMMIDGRELWNLSPMYYSPIGDAGYVSDVNARVEDDAVAAIEIWVGGAGE